VHDRDMTVEAIHIGAREAAELHPVDSAIAVAGKGLEGDRHFHEAGAGPGQALTLVDAAVVEDVGLALGETRRQVTVRGVQVNDLVGRRFRVGDVECLGVELCEPCTHLQEMTRPGIVKDLAHRAGINADIVVGGTIRVGDPVVELD
jgi:MOSC domain-containing protein YiiM